VHLEAVARFRELGEAVILKPNQSVFPEAAGAALGKRGQSC